jgi:hypothetical protein
VDYAVIRMLRGEPLPGSAKYYIHNWDAPLPDAVTKLEAYTRGVLEGKSVMQGPLTATSVPPSYIEQSVSMRNVVPGDRTHTIIPGISLRFLTAAIGAKSDSVEMALGFEGHLPVETLIPVLPPVPLLVLVPVRNDNRS